MKSNYYLLAFDDYAQDMRTYRVDRMKDIRFTGEPRDGDDVFKKIDLREQTLLTASLFPQADNDRHKMTAKTSAVISFVFVPSFFWNESSITDYFAIYKAASSDLRQKETPFIGMKTEFYTYQSHLHCIGQPNKKAENPLRPNQNCAASADFSCNCSLSAIRAMNSLLVGFPLVLDTV